jgi:hypothetical protein
MQILLEPAVAITAIVCLTVAAIFLVKGLRQIRIRASHDKSALSLDAKLGGSPLNGHQSIPVSASEAGLR